MFDRSTHRTEGFSLVELMVVIVIISVLVGIAVPSYLNKVLKAHRTEAKTALLDIAGREERYFNTNNLYSATAADVGYSGTWPQTIGNGYYTVTVTAPAAAAGALPTYTITATATGNQTKDTPCASFTLTSAGVQTSSPNTTDCWK
jgi:type IV pilus assembly protein PilE